MIKHFTIVFLFIVVQSASASAQQRLRNMIEHSTIFSKHFTGFVLANPKTNEAIYNYNDDKYFTPGSNTKMFTLYTCLRLMGERLPLLRYTLRGDSLIFSGTGNPALLHPFLPSDSSAFQLLRRQHNSLYFASSNFQDDRFAQGWMWEDYEFYDQPERSPLPLYGNVVQFDLPPFAQILGVKPKYFQSYVQANPNNKSIKPNVTRHFHENIFEYNSRPATATLFEEEIPFLYSDELCVKLLSDTLEKTVSLYTGIAPGMSESTILLGDVSADSIYRRMMQESDNFIAEQLLLLCSNELYGYMNTATIIAYAKQNLLSDLPDEPKWVDGSGLSRYNLVTPRSIVRLLQKMYTEYPSARLFDIFPAGGVSGTIKDNYGGDNGQPFVFAKTGTLSNNHSLSGYVVTKKGTVLVFSFMHNNYLCKVSTIKKEMEKVLTYIYNTY